MLKKIQEKIKKGAYEDFSTQKDNNKGRKKKH